jgi:hypothetical protein
MILLGVLALAEIFGVGLQLRSRSKPALASAVPAAPAPAPIILPFPPVPPTPAPIKPVPDENPAAEAEKSLVARLPKPTPAVRREITLESRITDLVTFAKGLRDRGDTATAMTRLREAQSLSPRHCLIISEMALTYEKMGLTDKAIEQWRRIYEMGESAGIYYAAAEAKLKALQLPPVSPEEPNPSTTGALTPETASDLAPILSLGQVGTIDDTGNTQPLRHLKLRVPILARQGRKIEPRDVVIQVFFYDQLKDGSLVETNANVTSSWTRRESPTGDLLPVDWSSPDPETLEVEYTQPSFDRNDPRTRERRIYFGYSVRVYYKGVLNAKFADPVKLLNQFIPPSTLPSSDLPQ